MQGAFTIDGVPLAERSYLQGFLAATDTDTRLAKLVGSKGKHSIREQIEPHLSSIYDALKAFSDYNFQQLPHLRHSPADQPICGGSMAY